MPGAADERRDANNAARLIFSRCSSCSVVMIGMAPGAQLSIGAGMHSSSGSQESMFKSASPGSFSKKLTYNVNGLKERLVVYEA